MDLSIIIVSWNVKGYLRACLQSVYDTVEGISFEVIVVDNHSADDSAEMIKEDFSSVRLIENSINKGFAFASNQGISCSAAQTVLLLNPDTVILPHTVNKTLGFLMSHPEAGVVTCKKTDQYGNMDTADFLVARFNPFLFRFFNFVKNSLLRYLLELFPRNKLLYKKLFNEEVGSYNFPLWNKREAIEIECALGSFMMIKKAVINDAGPLDEKFFFGFDDFDFCYRVKNKGWKVFLCPQYEIIHFKEKSISQWQKNNKYDALAYSRSLLYFKYTGKAGLILKTLLIISAKIVILTGIFFLDLIFPKRKKNANKSVIFPYAYDGRVITDIKNLIRVIFSNEYRFH